MDPIDRKKGITAMKETEIGKKSIYRKMKLNFNLFDVFVFAFCVTFAIICFYPMWYVFVVSVTPYKDFINKSLVLFPPLKPDFQYYVAIFTSQLFKNSIIVSVVKTLIGTLLSVLVTSMMAYGVSKSKIKGMKTINFLVVFTMFFSGGLIPTYFLYRDLHLLKTFWVMVIPSALSTVYFIIMRNYFSYSVPSELEEAATIDGANDIKVFYKIVLPISIPMMAAISLFIAVIHWNDYYNYMMYVNVTKYQPYVWVLRRMLVEHSLANQLSAGAAAAMGTPKIPAFALRMATIVCAMLPIMVVYPFLQKYFAKGILIGAVKG